MTTPDPTLKARVALGTAFTGAGVAHIVKHEWFEQLVPDSMAKWSKQISAVTTVIQLVGGISMFIPRLRGVARWLNLGMLVPSLVPAIGQIKTPEKLRAAGLPPALAPVRVLVQIGVIAATWWATRPAVEEA